MSDKKTVCLFWSKLRSQDPIGVKYRVKNRDIFKSILSLVYQKYKPVVQTKRFSSQPGVPASTGHWEAAETQERITSPRWVTHHSHENPHNPVQWDCNKALHCVLLDTETPDPLCLLFRRGRGMWRRQGRWTPMPTSHWGKPRSTAGTQHIRLPPFPDASVESDCHGKLTRVFSLCGIGKRPSCKASSRAWCGESRRGHNLGRRWRETSTRGDPETQRKLMDFLCIVYAEFTPTYTHTEQAASFSGCVLCCHVYSRCRWFKVTLSSVLPMDWWTCCLYAGLWSGNVYPKNDFFWIYRNRHDGD